MRDIPPASQKKAAKDTMWGWGALQNIVYLIFLRKVGKHTIIYGRFMRKTLDSIYIRFIIPEDPRKASPKFYERREKTSRTIVVLLSIALTRSNYKRIQPNCKEQFSDICTPHRVVDLC